MVGAFSLERRLTLLEDFRTARAADPHCGWRSVDLGRLGLQVGLRHHRWLHSAVGLDLRMHLGLGLQPELKLSL